ncbi:hypothetical protein MKK70_00165 [Methylobacterium sp. E-041]|uniref:hypothetical protein n=1 Tax=Methylobacterium sp. E-041 TaxID=2836573 RepID=UPI001FB887B1|nr:hypothetical protein [Methylobacterium sp. E-041]MCJ2103818.1 hypothetical protein [Methylobacterium sp. E-041]
MAIDKAEIRARATFVTSQCEGIQPFHEVLYLQSILYAADRTHAIFARFDTAIMDGIADATAFSLVQEALSHAAALSRFFWPTRQGGEHAQARGQKLRKAFELDDTSALRERRLRDAFEHFDERLDRFLLENDAGTFFPDPRVGDHALADMPTDKIFKLVDPDAAICVLLGEKFAYEPIRREVDRVLGLTGAVGSGGRLPRPGETRGVKPAEAYDRFHAKWAPRLGLKEQHLAEAFKRGHDPDWDHVRPESVPPTPGHVRILLTLGDATMLGSVEPADIQEMVEEWRHQLAARKGDHRVFTRRIISQYMALNQHRGERAELLLCGALWLIVTKDDTQEIVSLMRRGDIEVRYDIAFLDEEQQTRFRLGWRDLRQ